MKKFLALTLAVILALTLVACGNEKTAFNGGANSNIEASPNVANDSVETEIKSENEEMMETEISETTESTESGENTETTEATEATESTETAESETDDISPEFKEAMDSYEIFFDEYCEFMKKYSETEDTSSMLVDYAKYMGQYAETMAKMSAINEDELSDAELLYYIEVTGRITTKLSEVNSAT